MLSIGEFSKLAKTSVRTLRFYDEIDLFKPKFVEDNGYRYYELKDLDRLIAIVELKELGVSLKDIKSATDGGDLKTVLSARSESIRGELEKSRSDLIRIGKILEKLEKGEYMSDYIACEKLLPKVTVYYRHGVITEMSKMVEFILGAGEECRANNPDLKCATPEYCFITYEADEYQEKNVELEYAEAVEKAGKESENIKFKTLQAVQAVCVTHKGEYGKLKEAYAFALDYVN